MNSAAERFAIGMPDPPSHGAGGAAWSGFYRKEVLPFLGLSSRALEHAPLARRFPAPLLSCSP